MPESRRSPLAILLSLALPLLAVPACAAPPPAPAAGDAAFVAETREYLGRLAKLGFAGVVLVARNGAPLLAEGYGLADRERGIAWGPGTVSDIGSITKQFTAAAILSLAEEGRLKVTDPLTAHFEGVPEDKRAITLHQLLTHSSGIVDLEGEGDWDPILRDEFVRRIFAQPLAFPPGGGYEYSNAGYSLLGAIVERLSGGSYERFVRERLFLPHGLYETGYVLAGWGDGRMAQGYEGAEKWGTTLDRPLAEDGPFWVLRANGGIHTTAYDMLRWAEALLAGRVLSAASREQLWTPHVAEEQGGDSFYGYGWAVQDVEGFRVVTHNGGNGVFFADLALVPNAGIVVFLQTNVAAGKPYVQQLLGRIGFRLAAGRPYPEVPNVVPADPAHLAALAGDWTLADGGRLRATAEADALLLEPLDADGLRAPALDPAAGRGRPRARRRARPLVGRGGARPAGGRRGSAAPPLRRGRRRHPGAAERGVGRTARGLRRASRRRPRRGGLGDGAPRRPPLHGRPLPLRARRRGRRLRLAGRAAGAAAGDLDRGSRAAPPLPRRGRRRLRRLGPALGRHRAAARRGRRRGGPPPHRRRRRSGRRDARAGAMKKRPRGGLPGGARRRCGQALLVPRLSVQAPRPRVPATSTWCTAS